MEEDRTFAFEDICKLFKETSSNEELELVCAIKGISPQSAFDVVLNWTWNFWEGQWNVKLDKKRLTIEEFYKRKQKDWIRATYDTNDVMISVLYVIKYA